MCAKLKSPDEFKSLIEVVTYFKDEKTCLDYLEQWLWNGEIRCPYCGMIEPYRYKDGRLKCRNCKEVFSAKKNTIFESSKIPLVKWYMAIFLIATHKKGISSSQLARDLNITQKSAWFLSHRIRKAMVQDTKPLEGTIEIDETFVGGKNKNRHKDKKVVSAGSGRNYQDKTPILGMVERGGEYRTIVVPNTGAATLRPLIRQNVKNGSTIYTDDWKAYNALDKYYNHTPVDHSKGRFRIGEACSNRIESFWSHLKRMIIGVYVNVSPKHLQKYADEITFRFNTREMTTGERLKLLFTKLKTRLSYKQLIAYNGYSSK